MGISIRVHPRSSAAKKMAFISVYSFRSFNSWQKLQLLCVLRGFAWTENLKLVTHTFTLII